MDVVEAAAEVVVEDLRHEENADVVGPLAVLRGEDVLDIGHLPARSSLTAQPPPLPPRQRPDATAPSPSPLRRLGPVGCGRRFPVGSFRLEVSGLEVSGWKRPVGCEGFDRQSHSIRAETEQRSARLINVSDDHKVVVLHLALHPTVDRISVKRLHLRPASPSPT